MENADFDSDGDFMYFMRKTHRKQGLPRFRLKQPSTEPIILRSVDGIDFHGNHRMEISLKMDIL